MKNRIANILRQKRLTLHISAIVLILIAAIIAYFYSGRLTEKNEAGQMLHREQIIARAGAKSIRTYINLTKRSLLVLSRSPRVLSLNETAKVALDDFVRDWEGSAMVETILVDDKGKIMYIATKGITDEDKNVDFTDRDYFKWAKTAKAGEVFVGDPIQARVGQAKGEYIITLATPIIKNNEFKGVLVSAILISSLTEDYLNPLKVSEDSKVYLIDSQGGIVYADIEPLIGVNLFDYLNDHSFPGSDLVVAEVKNKFDKIINEGEGKLVYIRNDYNDELDLKKWLLAYSSINIATTSGEQNWILVVETPNSDAMLYSGSFFRNQTLVLVFFIFVLVVITCIGIFTSRIEARDAYLKGFHQGQKAKRT